MERPTSVFRAGAFSMLFVAVWNSVAIAILQRDGGEWRELDEDGEVVRVHGGVERARETGDLVGAALPGVDRAGLRQNVDFWVELRNAVAHRFLPALDVMVIPHAQAGVLNFEDVLRVGSARSSASVTRCRCRCSCQASVIQACSSRESGCTPRCRLRCKPC